MDESVDLDASDPGAEPRAEAAGSPALPVRPIVLAFIGVVIAAQLAALAWSVIKGPQGPWRGEYFEGKKFEGDSRIRYARKLEFEFENEPPFRGMPRDKWSATYTTCLEVDEEAEYRFRLTSDDGSRFYIDGERLIDNWGSHAPRTRTGKILLEPGTYVLEVEYFESSHGAELKLVAAIGEGGGKHETIPPTMLRQPGDDADAPCG